MSGEEAKQHILAEDPTINAQVLPEGSAVTRDYRPDRVRIFVDPNGIVIAVPRRG